MTLLQFSLINDLDTAADGSRPFSRSSSEFR